MQTQNMYELAEHLKQLREEKKNAEQRVERTSTQKSHRQSISFLCRWQKQKRRISPVQERCLP